VSKYRSVSTPLPRRECRRRDGLSTGRLLGRRQYDCSYIAQATTPGEFVVPPTRAEEIYAPETFGRAATAESSSGESARQPRR
jgi:Bacterial Alpha-2-macroglobulin MG10 domain